MEAEAAYLARLRQVLSCLTPAVLARYPGLRRGISGPFAAVLNRGEPARLASAQVLWLDVKVQYVVERSGESRTWIARTAGYIYAVQDSDGLDMLAYHWHADGASRVTGPHLHVDRAEHELINGRDHLVTGFVLTADFVRMLIEEFGVLPRRADWRSVVDTARQFGDG